MGTMSVSLKPTEAELEEIISSDWYKKHEFYTDLKGNKRVHVYGEPICRAITDTLSTKNDAEELENYLKTRL